MSDPDAGSVTDWLHSLESEDSEAIRNLWDRYFDKLVQLAGRRVQQHTTDEESIASSVFASLWRGARAGRFRSVQNRDELWWLLLRLTRMKIADNARKRTARKRGGGIPHVPADSSEAEGFQQLISREPTPDDLVALDEEIGRLLTDLRDDQLRQIAILRMEGYSHEEIAAELSVSTATVARKLRLIRGTWATEIGE